ncbi:MAG: GGDEF domain-containing protein [Burkholderiaceae bacterium]|jgi:diguanylate cyclase (GGDEF)-like protein
MEQNILWHILTPAKIHQRSITIACLLAIVGVFIVDSTADYLVRDDVRMTVVYVFPLTVLGMHCERKLIVALGLLLALFGTCYSTIVNHRLGAAMDVEMFIELAAFALVVFLARHARQLYLETLVLAELDSLTGLHNRRTFVSTTEIEIAKQRRYGGAFSLVLIDLDDFKKLNDSKGHLAGDAALKLLGKLFQENKRQTDFVARLGGDEFVILMPYTVRSDCGSFSARLGKEIFARMADAGFVLSASIGYTTFERPPESVASALQKADDALYKAKANGKGCVVGV